MGKREEWTEGDVRRFLTNPFYCLTADPLLAHPHEPLVSEAQWIDAAVKMIDVGVIPHSTTPLDSQVDSRHNRTRSLLECQVKSWAALPSCKERSI